MLQTHSEEKEDNLVAVQKPKVREKWLSYVCKTNELLQKVQGNTLILVFQMGQKYKVSERLTFGVIKTVMFCVEDDQIKLLRAGSDQIVNPLQPPLLYGFGCE